MNTQGLMKPHGDLGLRHITRRGPGWRWKLSNNLRWSYIRGWIAVHIGVPIANTFGLLTQYGTLSMVKNTLDADQQIVYKVMMDKAFVIHDPIEREKAIGEAKAWAWANGSKIDYGVVGFRSVTTAFVTFMVDQLQVDSTLWGDFKFHDSGVGITAENITDTIIETTDGEARATGTQTESAANAYRSVGTIAYTTTKAITEHGLFNDVTAGTLMDRTVFAAVNVVNGESIQFSYTLTVNAGG